ARLPCRRGPARTRVPQAELGRLAQRALGPRRGRRAPVRAGRHPWAAGRRRLRPDGERADARVRDHAGDQRRAGCDDHPRCVRQLHAVHALRRRSVPVGVVRRAGRLRPRGGDRAGLHPTAPTERAGGAVAPRDLGRGARDRRRAGARVFHDLSLDDPLVRERGVEDRRVRGPPGAGVRVRVVRGDPRGARGRAREDEVRPCRPGDRSEPGIGGVARWRRTQVVRTVSRSGVALTVVIVAGLAAFPFVFQANWVVNIAVFTMMYAGLATAWNLLGGYSGYISLCNAAFFGVGAYAIANLFPTSGGPPGSTAFLILPLLGLGAAILSIPIGWVAFRTRGVTFAIVTISLLFVGQTLAFLMRSFTRGSQGMGIGVPRFPVATYERPFYLALLAIFVFAVSVCWYVGRAK